MPSVQVDRELDLRKEDFGASLHRDSRAVALPAVFEKLLASYRIKTALELLSALAMAPGAFSRCFGWTVQDVKAAEAQLRDRLKDEFPTMPGLDAGERKTPRPLGAMPPPSRGGAPVRDAAKQEG